MVSDGIILSSPGYVWNVSALMKNFQDRFAFSFHRPIFYGQKLLLVASGGSGLGRSTFAREVEALYRSMTTERVGLFAMGSQNVFR